MIEKMTFTIRQFCLEHEISKTTLYQRISEGLGPRLMKVGRRTFISVESARDWRLQCEQERTRAAAAKAGLPLFENWRQRKARLPKTADYPESMVRRVAGTVERRPYVPPIAIRINQARAAAHQPPMISISSRVGDLR